MYLEEDSLDFAAVFPHFLIYYGVQNVFGRDPGVGDALVVAHHPDENVWDAVLRLKMNTYRIDSTSSRLFPQVLLHTVKCLYTVYSFRLYLVSEETELLQEVLHQLEFVSDCVFLHLSPDLLGLLTHAVLQMMSRGEIQLRHIHTANTLPDHNWESNRIKFDQPWERILFKI